jgi:hypothetical protein
MTYSQPKTPSMIAQSIEWLVVYDIATARALPKLTPYSRPRLEFRSSDFRSCCPPPRLPPDLPCPRHASRSSARHPPVVAAAASLHPMARASKSRAPHRSPRSPAWPLGGSASPPHWPLVERKPQDILLLCLRVRLRRILGEAVGRDETPIRRLSAKSRRGRIVPGRGLSRMRANDAPVGAMCASRND